MIPLAGLLFLILFWFLLIYLTIYIKTSVCLAKGLHYQLIYKHLLPLFFFLVLFFPEKMSAMVSNVEMYIELMYINVHSCRCAK